MCGCRRGAPDARHAGQATSETAARAHLDLQMHRCSCRLLMSGVAGFSLQLHGVTPSSSATPCRIVYWLSAHSRQHAPVIPPALQLQSVTQLRRSASCRAWVDPTAEACWCVGGSGSIARPTNLCCMSESTDKRLLRITRTNLLRHGPCHSQVCMGQRGRCTNLARANTMTITHTCPHLPMVHEQSAFGSQSQGECSSSIDSSLPSSNPKNT